jgi:maltose alpha-D-glucosyltransferase/alpha-amylase
LDNSDYYVKGYNYFSPEGKGSLDDFVTYTEYLYNRLGDKGMFTTPTGTHDEVRMPTGKSPDMIKTIFAFMLTYKHIPFVYYGDEIGMEHNFTLSKDGGGIRTGARTPMQWTDGKNCGFSTADEIYLPIRDTHINVKAQDGVDGSILETVKALTKINLDLPYSVPVKVIDTDYPFVYQRQTEKGVYKVFLQPAKTKTVYNIGCGEVVLSSNCVIENGTITTDGVAFAIVLEK